MGQPELRDERKHVIEDYLEEKCKETDKDRFIIKVSTIIADTEIPQTSLYNYGGGKFIQKNFDGVGYQENSGKLMVIVDEFLGQ